jgi:uncharacterized protein (TIGR03437 family)
MKFGIITALFALPFALIGIVANAQVPPVLTSPVLTSMDKAGPSRQAAASYAKLPLAFEPNRGQTDAQVQFVARGAGYTIFLGSASATFALQSGSQAGVSTVIRMDLLGANPKTLMEAQDRLPGTSNYLMGSTQSKWPTNLPTYAKARSRNAYPGIDLVYYGTQGQLEYDFVLAPKADPTKIRLKFAGATPVVEWSGDLILSLTAESAPVRFHKPVVYQEIDGIRHIVNGRFTLASAPGEVGFEVAAYDRSRGLVIDPTLIYASYLGGSSQASPIYGMTINASGQIYVTGVTNALDFKTTPGVVQGNCPASPASNTKCGPSSFSAAFVSKIAADGQSLIYSTYLGGGGSGPGVGGPPVSDGGSGSDSGTGIAVDAQDNAWIVGNTNSNNFPVTPDAYSLYCEPESQSFNFTTLQNVGEFSGCARFGGGEYNYSGSYSLFVVKLNPKGTSILYGTFLGGTQGEGQGQIAVDAAGHIIITAAAYTASVGAPTASGQYVYPSTANAFQSVPQPNQWAAVVTEFAPDGHSLVYSSFLASPGGNTFAGALAVGAGKIFLGGFTQSPQLPTTAGALSKTCLGNSPTQCPNNGYVAEFDPSKSGPASLIFSTYLNGKHSSAFGVGQSTSMVNVLAADAAGNVYAGGSNKYPDFPTTPGALQTTCPTGNFDFCGTGFVTKLSPTGALVWSTFYGSPSASGQYGVSAIALDAANDVYIANLADGAGDLPLKNGLQSYTSGVAYVAELSSDGSQVLFGSFFGGGANIIPSGLAIDAAGDAILAGYTTGSLPLASPLQATAAGGFNQGFFAKIAGAVLPPAITSVTAAESESTTIAPNTWIEIKGSGLAQSLRIWQGPDFVNLQLPTQLDGVSVKMNGENAYVYYLSPSQLNVLTPPDLAPGPVQVTVTTAGGASRAFTVQGQPLSPSFFVLGGGPYVAAVHLLSGDVGPANLYPGLTTPAKPGEVVMLYAGGFGPTSPPVVLGSASQFGNLPTMPTIQIGGMNANVSFAGLISPGLFQFNVQIPASAPIGDDVITARYNGQTTQSGTLITVGQ